MRAVAECALVRRPSAASQLDISHTIGLHKSFVAPCRRRRHSTCEPSRHVYDDFAPPGHLPPENHYHCIEQTEARLLAVANLS